MSEEEYNFLDDMLSSLEEEKVEYAYVVPCYSGEVAYLIWVHQDVYIQKYPSDSEGYFYVSKHKNLSKYLREIQSGAGNWIISPDHDNSDLKWSELDYRNAKVVTRKAKIVKDFSYSSVDPE